MIFINEDNLPEYAATLRDFTRPIADRVSALFCLRTVGSLEAIDALQVAFDMEPSSELLKHEICYVLG